MATKKSPKKTSPKKKTGVFPMYVVLFAVIVIFTLVVMMQLFTISALSNKVDSLNHSMGGVIDEVGTKLSVADQLEVFAQDLNEIRSYLYLPNKTYSFANDDQESLSEGDSKDTRINAGLFALVEDIHVTKATEDDLAAHALILEDIRTEEVTRETLSEYGLAFGTEVITGELVATLSLLDARGEAFTRLVYHADTGEWEMWDYTGSTYYDEYESFENALENYIDGLSQHLEQYSTYLQTENELSSSLTAPEHAELFMQHNATLAGLTVRNPADEPLAQIMVSPETREIVWKTDEENKATFSDIPDFLDALPGLLASLDTRTAIEQAIDKQKGLVEELISDEAFQTVLADYELKVAPDPIEEDDRYYYPITDAGGTIVQQIVIEKNASADIFVVDAEGLNPTPLSTYAETEGLKKK